MKKFVVDENWTVFADLAEVSEIRAIEKTVDVIINDSGHYLVVYGGKSHADAAEFAERLAAEVDAAKEAHIAKLLKQNGEESEKHALKFIADNSEKPITDIHGKTIEPFQIAALYINELGDVRAILSENDIVTLNRNINIDELAKFCNLYTVDDFKLYVDPGYVKKVFIDCDCRGNIVVFVMIYDFDLAAGIYDEFYNAVKKLEKLKKDFNL